MNRVLVKSGVKQLPLFAGRSYPFYEAYLQGDENLNELLQTKMRLVALHMPHHVSTSQGKVPVNFCDDGEGGKASFHKLRELQHFAQQQGVEYIIIHAGFFDSLTQDRYSVLNTVASRFSSLSQGQVKLCLENVPCWTNHCLEQEPIISTAEHFLYLQKRCPGLGITLDVDHAAINAVFQQFYRHFKSRYLQEQNHPGFERKRLNQEMEEEMMRATKAQPDYFREIVHQNIRQFLAAVTPTTIHAVGSDFCNYRFVDQLPLVGEALPLGFTGKIKGFAVEDRIDHTTWIDGLPSPVAITLELMLRPEYDYLEQLQQNYTFVSGVLSRK